MRKGLQTLALSGLLVASVAAASCAATISPRSSAYRQDVRQHAFDEGRTKGLTRGGDDARHGQTRAPDRYKEYRDADGGYRRGDGDRGTYRTAFQEGFRAGYAQAFKQQRDADGRDRGR